MAVLLETSIGELVIDLYPDLAPETSRNFLKLCKLKYYHNSLFFDVQKDYLAIAGDPTNTGSGGSSALSLVTQDRSKRYLKDEVHAKYKFNKLGLVAMANHGPDLNASAFMLQLTNKEITSLNRKHTIFGFVSEDLDGVLEKLNKTIVDEKHRPYQNIRIKRIEIIEDPFDDYEGQVNPSRSPSPI